MTPVSSVLMGYGDGTRQMKLDLLRKHLLVLKKGLEEN
jgi:hypothetical protein